LVYSPNLTHVVIIIVIFIWFPSVAVEATINKVIPTLAPSFIASFVDSFLIEEEAVATSSALWHILS
jgi:hypothetical protein